MSTPQARILAEMPKLARYLPFSLVPGIAPERALTALTGLRDDGGSVVGLGQSLIRVVGQDIPGLRLFPRHAGAGFTVPSTPAALWMWLKDDAGTDDIFYGNFVGNTILDDTPHVGCTVDTGALASTCMDDSVLDDNVVYTRSGPFLNANKTYLSADVILTGDIGEIIVYDSALSLVDIDQVGEYLAAKWGTTWTPQ